MAAGPKRRTVRLAHLNAATVPVEQALIAIADENTETAVNLHKTTAGDGIDEAAVREIVAQALAEHDRKFAEEMHWRG